MICVMFDSYVIESGVRVFVVTITLRSREDVFSTYVEGIFLDAH